MSDGSGTIVSRDAPPQPSDRRRPALPGWAVGVGVAIAALPFVSLAWFALRAPRTALVATMPDDTFYYLEIGQRAARGEGFTFDGTRSTSGYHPLWQWIVTVSNWIVPGETAQIRALRLLSLVVVAIAFAIAARVIWRSCGPLPALGGVILASHSVADLRSMTSGMETPVVLLALALCFAALQSYFVEPGRRRAVYVGLASALLVLARLDMAMVLPLLAIAVLTRAPRARNLGGWLAGGAVIGVPYAAYHLAAHGSLLTTSATVKERWVDDHISRLGGWFGPEHLDYLRHLGRSYADAIGQQATESAFTRIEPLLALTIAGLAILGAWSGYQNLRARGGGPGPTGSAGAWMAGVAGAKLVADLVLVPLWVLAWYAAVGHTTALFLIGAAAGSGLSVVLSTRRPALLVPVLVLAALAVVPSGLALTVTDDPPGLAWQREIDRAATWLEENRPDGSYGAFDAGLLGYRMDAVTPVENLDGLVNDADFAGYLAARPSNVEVVAHEQIDVLVHRVPSEQLETEWGCASILWEGDESISSVDPERPDKVYVLDVSGCR